MAEFDLIEQHFSDSRWQSISSVASVLVNNGDDCAVVLSEPESSLAVSMDTLIAGVHFPENTSPVDIAHKALAVNLSDLAAMGAKPAWFLLSITLPHEDHVWLKSFSDELYALAKTYDCPLVGGDTTKGPLSITVQITGSLPKGKALRRSGAQLGDNIYVSGYLGQAAAGLQQLKQQTQVGRGNLLDVSFLQALNRPQAQLDLGQALLGTASACIDVSDGLLGDLGHICTASKVGGVINMERLLISDSLQNHYAPEQCWDLMLSGGDDYELCFTASPDNDETIKQLALSFKNPITKIGSISDSGRLECKRKDGSSWHPKGEAYRHF